jgi:YHS domain-containing protein
MKRLLALGLMLGTFVAVLRAPGADTKDKAEAKEALKALQEFIGGWKGSGNPEKPRPTSGELWSEAVNWSWRFKGDDAWLTMEVKGGKYFKGGEVRYLPARKEYQLTATTAQGKTQVFAGPLKNDILTLERVDPDTRATEQIKMNLAAEGVRFIYRVAHRDEGRTIWKKDYVVACTREGESLGAREKKNECVVSGGLGTMAVSHKGETYWVCCSGCRDAFNENPEKYIAEYKAKKAGKK